MTSQGTSITRFRLNRAALKQVPREEVELFLTLGHLHNELTLLQRLVIWSFANAENAAEPHLQGQITQTMIFLRYLGARIFEGWQTLRRDFFGPPRLSQIYEADLVDVARQSCESVKSYMSRSNPLKALRNGFAFHSSGEDIGPGLDHLADETLDLYLGTTLTESLFYASEVVLDVAILGTAEFDKREDKLSNLVGEIVDQSTHWIVFIQGLADVFLKRHPSVQDEVLEFNLLELESFEEVHIPWFTNTVPSTRRESSS